MNSATARKVFTGLRWFLALLFLWAAISKLSNPIQFLGSIYAYQLPFPRLFLQLIAIVLPWLEFLCGLFLLLNVWPETALFCACGLLLVFVMATGQAWARHINISCGCFDLKILGLNQNHPGLVEFVESVGFAFIRNLVLTVIAVFLLRARLAELRPAAIAQKPITKQQKRAASV